MSAEGMIKMLPRAMEIVRQSGPANWHAYRCESTYQQLDRLYLHDDRGGFIYEIQLNWITHAEGPHFHRCNMASFMLARGYGYWLQQAGSPRPRYQFAAPGSIVTMGMDDVHWIPRSKERSLSLCLFDCTYNDFHKTFPPLSDGERAGILMAAKCNVPENFEVSHVHS